MKRKKYFILWMFLFACLMAAGSGGNIPRVRAASDFTIEEIDRTTAYGGTANFISGVEPYEGVEGVWVTTEDISPLHYKETVTGKVGSDVKAIRCWNSMEGTAYSDNKQKVEYTVTINEDLSFQASAGEEYITKTMMMTYGAYNLYFEIEKEDGSKRVETLIVDNKSGGGQYIPDSSKNYEYPKAVHILDASSKADLAEADIDFLASGSKIKYLDLTGSDECVQFQIEKDCKKEESETSAVNWLSNASNYIVVNGDRENKIQFCATNDKYGEYYSQPISLQKGYNIVEVYSDCYLCRLVNSASGSYNEAGINLNSLYFANECGTTYIIKSNGTKSPEQSSDTSLRMVEATSINSSTNRNYACTQDENGNWHMELPLEYEKTKGTAYYTKACIGITTTDPGAKVEILDLAKVGITLGIYSVYDTAELEELKVKVTATDGTEKIHTIQIDRVGKEADINSFTLDGGTMDQAFNKTTTSYQVDVTEEKLTYTLSTSIGARVLLNSKELTGTGEDGKEYSFEVDPGDYHSILEVISEDYSKENKYYFHYNDPNNETLYEIPESTKQTAREMLDGWYSRSDEAMNETTSSGYWGTFMARATDVDLKEKVIYDVTTHKMNQATDWAGCILELVMVGENPYDFEGTNYINGLLGCYDEDTGGYGPYACNIWTLQAMETAGYPVPDSLIQKVKNQALTNGPDFDMRSWAVAAISEYLTEDEKAQILVDYKNAQVTEENYKETTQIGSEKEIGLFYSSYYPNVNTATNGDILMALGQMNVNLEAYFDVDGKNPLTVLRDNFMKDGGFVYDLAGTYEGGFSKDMMIGLGDIIKSQNVWASYTLTDEMKEALVSQAETLVESLTDAKQVKAIQNAITAAKEVSSGDKAFGRNYFALYEAVAEADASMNLYGRMCTLAQSKAVDSVIDAIGQIGDLDLQSGETLENIRSDYDSLGSDRVKGYVSNYDILEKSEEDYTALVEAYLSDLDNKLEALGDIDKLTLDQKAAVEEARSLYDALNGTQQKAVSNRNILTLAENKMAALEAEALITALPDQPALEQADDVAAARTAYNALTKAQKALVSDDAVEKLEDAETTIANLKQGITPQSVTDQINALGETPSEKAVAAARASYDALSDSQKKQVTDATLALLKKGESYVASTQAQDGDATASKVTLNKESLSLAQDATAYLTAEVTPDKESVIWSSSDPSVARVDNSGVVTTYKDGTTVITAKTKDGASASCKVTVVSKLQAKASQTARTVKLSWKKIAGSKGYEIFRYSEGRFRSIATVSAKKASYTVKYTNGKTGTRLNSGTKYTFQVRSYVLSGSTKVYKKAETVKTATKPARVSLKKAAKRTSTSVNLSWGKVKGSGGYQVLMKTSVNGAWQKVKLVTGASRLSCTKTGLKKNKTYYFKVRAWKKVNGKTIYGASSKAKKVKI